MWNIHVTMKPFNGEDHLHWSRECDWQAAGPTTLWAFSHMDSKIAEEFRQRSIRHGRLRKGRLFFFPSLSSLLLPQFSPFSAGDKTIFRDKGWGCPLFPSHSISSDEDGCAPSFRFFWSAPLQVKLRLAQSSGWLGAAVRNELQFWSRRQLCCMWSLRSDQSAAVELVSPSLCLSFFFFFRKINIKQWAS